MLRLPRPRFGISSARFCIGHGGLSGYEVVHVDIGLDGKKNGDVAKQFDTPLDKGIPALAVVEADGKVVVSQKNGEFEDARSLTPEVLLEFLNKWKLEAR